MPQEQPITQETIQKRRDFVPKLMELNEKVLFGDMWERPGLSKRDRSLITVATFVALYRTNEIPFHELGLGFVRKSLRVKPSLNLHIKQSGTQTLPMSILRQ